METGVFFQNSMSFVSYKGGFSFTEYYFYYFIDQLQLHMSTRPIASDSNLPSKYFHSNYENNKLLANRDLLRDITPKKLNVPNEDHSLTRKYKFQNLPPYEAYRKPSFASSQLGSDLPDGNSQPTRQRQLQRIKQSYDQKLEQVKIDHEKVLKKLQEQCRQHLKEKNYWKELAQKNSYHDGSHGLFPTQKPNPLKNDAEEDLNQKIKKLQEELQKYRKENAQFSGELSKIKENYKSAQEKLFVQENLLRNAEMAMKDLKQKLSRSKQKTIPEFRSKSPLKFTMSSSIAGSSKGHHNRSYGSHHHNHSHNKNGESSKAIKELTFEIQSLKKTNRCLNDNIEQINEQLMKQKMKNLNNKFANK